MPGFGLLQSSQAASSILFEHFDPKNGMFRLCLRNFAVQKNLVCRACCATSRWLHSLVFCLDSWNMSWLLPMVRGRDDLTFRALSWGGLGVLQSDCKPLLGAAKTAALSIFTAMETLQKCLLMAGGLLSFPKPRTMKRPFDGPIGGVVLRLEIAARGETATTCCVQ